MVIKHRLIDSRPGDICGIDGGAHRWEIVNYERYIGQGTCDCGAVRFFSNHTFPSRELILRLKFLNDKYGKPGKVYQGPAPSRVEGLIINTSTSIKEGNMDKQTENPGTITLKSGAGEALPPIPPKPDVSGMSPKHKAMALHDYYEANAAAILQCRQEEGDTAARKLWGFSYKGWESFLKRHDITERLKPPVKRIAPETKASPSPAKAAHLAKMRAARGKKCLTCEHGYDKPDGYRLCSLDKCPYRLPLSIRAPYFPRFQEAAPPPVKPAPEEEMVKFIKGEKPATGVNVEGKFEPNAPPFKFPAWNEGWSDAVKAVWLKSYVEIYRIEWARETKHKVNWLMKILCWWRW